MASVGFQVFGILTVGCGSILAFSLVQKLQVLEALEAAALAARRECCSSPIVRGCIGWRWLTGIVLKPLR